MSNKQDLLKALDALAKAKDEDKKAITKAEESYRQTRKAQMGTQSHPS